MHGHGHVIAFTAEQLRKALFVVVAMAFTVTAGQAQTGAGGAPQELAVPATFMRWVKTPGAEDHVKRPTALQFDRFHDELLVADSGNNRIVVFTSSGSYKFEFSLGENVTAPVDVFADPAGFIFVLGSTMGGRALHCFDFDGVSVGDVPLPATYEGRDLKPRSGVCAEDGRIFLVDEASRRVLVVDPATGVLAAFAVGTPELADNELFGLGHPAIAGNELLIPVATAGMVLRYGLDGTARPTLGHFGAKPGSLNFPVAVAVSPEGIVAVLDQGRFCVVCYSADGRVLGEFGGKGHSPGWFMNPSLLAVPAADRVVVGQIFENKIQVCAVPDFVRGRNQHGAAEAAAPSGATDVRVSSHTSRPLSTHSSGSDDPQNTVPVSSSEVSE